MDRDREKIRIIYKVLSWETRGIIVWSKLEESTQEEKISLYSILSQGPAQILGKCLMISSPTTNHPSVQTSKFTENWAPMSISAFADEFNFV